MNGNDVKEHKAKNALNLRTENSVVEFLSRQLFLFVFLLYFAVQQQMTQHILIEAER